MTHAPTPVRIDPPRGADDATPPVLDDLLAAIERAAAAVRARTPLVQCLTNEVSSNLVANILLAAGASPAMVAAPDEANEFATVADAVLVNLGTMGVDHRASFRSTVAVARGAGTPWVLDPVAVGALSLRTRLAAELVADGPTVIRGNASEIRALAGDVAAGRGVDALDAVDDARAAATRLAQRSGAVVAVSGAVDLVTDGHVLVRAEGGHVLLTSITGAGCALGGLVAAVSAVTSPLVAAVTATAWFNAAADQAALVADGPASFQVAFVDRVYALSAAALVERAAACLTVGVCAPAPVVA